MPFVPVAPIARVRSRPAPQQTQGTAGLEVLTGAAVRAAQSTQEGGAQLQQLGETAAVREEERQAAQKRLAEREDSLRRLKAVAAVKQKLADLRNDVLLNGDLADPDQVEDLRRRSEEEVQSITSDLQFALPESSLKLQEQIIPIMGEWHGTLSSDFIEAGRAAMGAERTTEMQRLSALVLAKPGFLDTANALMDKWDADNFDGHATEAEQRAASLESSSAFAEAAVRSSLINLDYDGAQETLVKMADRLSSAKQNSLFNEIVVGQTANERKAAEIQAEINVRLGAMAAAGLEVDDETLASAMLGFNVSKARGAPTDVERLEAAEKYLAAIGAPPMTDEQRLQYLKALPPSATGGRLRERETLRQEANALADRVENGDRSPETTTAYLDVLNEMAQPSSFGAPRNLGVRHLRNLDVYYDMTTEDLAQARGIAPFTDAVTSGSAAAAGSDLVFGAGAATAMMQSPEEAEVARALEPADAPTRIMEQALEQGSEETPRPALDAMAAEGISFYEVAGMLTGPIPSLAERFSNVRLIGLLVQAPQTRRARLAFGFYRNFVSVLFKRSDRFGKMEQENVDTNVMGKIASSFIGEPMALRQDFEALDHWLGILESRTREVIEDTQRGTEDAVSREKLNSNMDLLADVRFARKLLGVPRRVPDEKTLDELLSSGSLQPGDFVRFGPDGILSQVQ